MLLTLIALSQIHAIKPNVVYIYADDLGFGELGCYGQKLIRTPNIDRMAKNGIRFTQHYSSSPVCAPARGSLLTGLSTRTSHVRENREFGDFSPDGVEGQEPLPDGTFTIGTMFQKAGYRTAAIGKWGLGGPSSSGRPLNQGFDYFFGYNCQRQAHNFYPTHLWENDTKVELDNPKFAAHQKFPEDADPSDPASYARYKGLEYSQDLLTGKAKDFIRDNSGRPFFLYLPYTIPHASLQVPDQDLSAYDGVFQESPYLGNQGYLPHIRPKSAYAAMITRLDRYVGEILATLKDRGLERNTLVMFSSDNGPTWVSGINPGDFGSTAGLRGRKAQLFEGGIRVPMIAYWPGKIKPSQVSSHVSVQYDLMATCSELIGEPIEGQTEGVSFLPTLLGHRRQTEHPFLYWEFMAHRAGQAVRMGDWKAIRFNRGPEDAKDTGRIALYNLHNDPYESNDVSKDHPDQVRRASRIFATRVPSHYAPWNW